MTPIENFTFLELNIDKICRICLKKSDDLVSVYNKIKMVATSEEERIAHILYLLTEISVNKSDELPTVICKQCLELVSAAFTLKALVIRSHNTLQQYLHHISKTKQNIDSKGNTGDDTQDDKVHEDIKQEIIESMQPEAKLYPCPICTKEFSALELRKHAHTHVGLKKYLKIPSSKRVSASKKFYEKSLQSNTTIFQRTEMLHRCIFCNKEHLATDLKLHYQDEHLNKEEFKCEQCGRVFRKINHLNTHRVKHLKEHPFECEKCGKGFVIKNNYDCHMLTHTSVDELPHECTICLKKFSNPEHLNRHQIIHTENVTYNVKYKVWKCYRCLKTFKDKPELNAHTCFAPNINLPPASYPCKICQKVYKNYSGLYNHRKTVHFMRGTKVLCSICGAQVTSIYNHMLTHTGKKPFGCDQCEKRFGTRKQLRQHLLVHSGLKPFVCSVCAKAFNNLYNMQVHERMHKGDRCHVCKVCNKGFLEKSYLRKHMSVHAKL